MVRQETIDCLKSSIYNFIMVNIYKYEMRIKILYAISNM